MSDTHEMPMERADREIRERKLRREAAEDLYEAVLLAFKRLSELNRDDEVGVRLVLSNALKLAREGR